MEMTQEFFEKIEAYIEGSLSEKEVKDFEKLINTNPELRKEIDIHRQLRHTLSHTKTLDFRKKLIKIGKEVAEEDMTKTKNKSFNYWKIAASLLLLIGLSSLLWFPFSSSDQDLFAEYYTPYPISYIKRGGNDTIDEDFKKAIFFYKNKEYKKAIPNLEKVVSTYPENETLQLCLGNAYLNTNQLEEAGSIFEKFPATSKFYDDAQWFMAFTYLKTDKKPKMIPILKKLVSENSKYKKNATQLLKEVEK